MVVMAFSLGSGGSFLITGPSIRHPCPLVKGPGEVFRGIFAGGSVDGPAGQVLCCLRPPFTMSRAAA